jgi:hypothetical protein
MEVGSSAAIPMGTCDSGCYGTYEAFSVPQVHRTFENSFWTKNQDQYKQQQNRPTYQISNVILKQTQIILPSDVNSQIIDKVKTDGTISMYLEGCQCVDTFINKKSASQDIQLPINYLQANTLQFLFRPQVYLDNSIQSFYYNSLRGVCPFTSIDYDPTKIRRGKGYLGKMTLHSQPVDGQVGAATAQLRIGDEYIPDTPLKGMQEIALSTKALSGDPNNSQYPIVAPILQNNIYDIMADEQFTTTYISTDLLGDQTLNYIQEWGLFHWAKENTYNPTAANTVNATIWNTPNVDMQALMLTKTSTSSFPYTGTVALETSFLPYAYQNPTLGYQVVNCVNPPNVYAATATGDTNNYATNIAANFVFSYAYPIQTLDTAVITTQWNCLPFYTTPDSSFILGFNLQMHPYDTGRLNSGRFLGNSNIILSLTNAVLAENEFLRITILTKFNMKLDIRAGGTMYTFL